MTNKVTMPDPMVEVDKHGVSSELQYTYLAPSGGLDHGTELITTDQAEAYANARVREALEEAANRVADPVNIEAAIENFAWGSHGNHVRAHLILRDAIEAIRALIPKEPPCTL